MIPMEHPHIDKYATLVSPIHNLDPRAKFLACITFIILVVLLDNIILLVTSIIFVFLLILVSKVPLGFIADRIKWIIPFGGFLGIFLSFSRPEGMPIISFDLVITTLTATREGLHLAALVILRATVAVMTITLLTSTTMFTDLIKAMEDLKIPKIFVQMTLFTYRYIFLLIDEFQRISRAQKSRGFGSSNLMHMRTMKTIGNTVGMLFVKSYERGERVYEAMRSRGY